MTMTTETIAQEAKRLLEPIPEEQWTDEHGYSDGVSKCCALGHWNRLHSSNPNNYNTINCANGNADNQMADIGDAFFNDPLFGYYKIAEVNDGVDDRYPQSTPKQRIMALLDDMIAAGF